LITPQEMFGLQQLAARYWARADGEMTESLSGLFTVDAELVLGKLVLSGRDAIEKFFEERDALHRATQRTTRHFFSNLRIIDRQEGRVTLRSNVIVYAGKGSLPLESNAPAGIADFEDVCVRQGVDGWIYARRAAISIFLGAEAAAFAK
jgi:SnoaL-like domain